MKKILLIATLFASGQLFAQETTKQSKPFSGKLHHSGYGALTTTYSKFNNEDALFLGAYGGWMLEHKLMLSVGGQ